MNPPEYRLRLFLSVDLAGSTAFKAGDGGKTVGETSEQAWVKITRQFYHEFPKAVANFYRQELNNIHTALEGKHPRTWKTVGDEILFCCRIVNLHHLCICINSFLAALNTYGEVLQSEETPLDVKGSGWVAAFPSPNVTVSLNPEHRTADQFPEEFEAASDFEFAGVDFLGNGVDTGFRISQFCSTSVFAMNVELAWLLSTTVSLNASAATVPKYQMQRIFLHLGRRELKGVIKGRPYPIIGIETERDDHRRLNRSAERRLLGGGGELDNTILRDFLFRFMKGEGIPPPYLPGVPADEVAGPPRSYQIHQEKWIVDAEGIVRAREQERAAGDAPEEGTTEMPPEVLADLASRRASVADTGKGGD